MELPLYDSLTQLTRQEKLLIWMRRARLTYRDLGNAAGICKEAMCTLCKQETMPPYRHEALVKLGVPQELLPIPFYQKPGKKPKASPHLEG